MAATAFACTTTSDPGTGANAPGEDSGDGSDASNDDLERVLHVELELEHSTLPLGHALPVAVTVRNRGQRSVTVPIEIALKAPDGNQVVFHRIPTFVPFNDASVERAQVTTSRWYVETGTFEVTASVAAEGIRPASTSGRFEVGEPTVVIPVFEDVTVESGAMTTVPEPECGQLANGAAWGDVDGDGWLDLVVTRLGEPVILFMNQGDGTFVDETAERGLGHVRGANGAAFADYDNDGHKDLVLVRDGPDLLFRNDGTGRFENVSEEAGIGGDGMRGMSASWGDFDGDGWLDLYVTTYVECTGDWTTEAEIIANVHYHTDALYRNNGDGTFTDVTHYLPDTRTSAGFAAAWLDVDGDHRPDLYLANDFVGPTPDHNRLWRNDGPGANGWSFTDVSVESGTGLFMNAMGIGISDVDRDGDLDIALSNIGGNKLLRNRGDGTFVEETSTGIERPSQHVDHPSITWGTSFYDLNLTGWEDLYISAGNLMQAPDDVISDQANMIFVNDGTGMTFLDVSALTGAADIDESKGVAFADFDRDGRIDMFVVNQAGMPRLYRNVTPLLDNHWLQLELVGTTSNRDACGAMVIVTIGEDEIRRTVLCGSGGTGSAHQHAVHFGLGTARHVDLIEIVWPSGLTQLIDGVDADRFHVIEEASN